ncbi:MAG TPA: NAD(P)/FAD-dependent oxidoreductase [Gemmataceae bacterium]|nr:NAD(P)/FAD-dependent oxidoreductase [Gemmataceae bacterium]
MPGRKYDAVVVGSGPNGLAAAITIARAGRSVLVVEAEAEFGGGMRSAELTLPEFIHDICSTAHPMAQISSFFRSLPLTKIGLEWAHPPAPLAHPLDDGTAAVLERSVDETAKGLGRDGDAYRRLFGPLVDKAGQLFGDALAPLGIPRHPLVLARFGLRAIRSARGLARSWFKEPRSQALFAGLAAHSMIPLEKPLSAAVALVLGATGHVAGWPVARGGSQKIANAMLAYLRALGGEAIAGKRVDSFDQIPPARVVLFDTSPGPMSRICGDRLPKTYRSRLAQFRHGPGVFKLDWALAGPIPWKAPECGRAATVHLGGTLEEVADSERRAWRGEYCERPFVLLAQQTICDPTRAPSGQHTGWAYCHVPNGSPVNMTERIEAQVERFAPGFRQLILARHVMAPAEFQKHNANYIGGDIGGGAMNFSQTFTRPVARLVPYSTPNRGIYLCSASTPPGPGVHGLCGYFAAKAALKRID